MTEWHVFQDQLGQAIAWPFSLNTLTHIYVRYVYFCRLDPLSQGIGGGIDLPHTGCIYSRRGCKPETQKFPSADQHGLSRAWSMSSCIARMTSSWVYDLALGSSASRRASSTSRVIRAYSSGHSACSMRSDACPSRCSRPNSRMSLVATTCSRIRSWITSQARCASGVAVPS